jgi:hypothetical protein
MSSVLSSVKPAARSVLGLGLAAAALVSLAAARPAAAQAPSSTTTSHNYNYSVTFTTPSSFRGAGSGAVRFEFDPDSANAAPASATGRNLTYSNDWQINPFGITTFGDATFNIFSSSVTIRNTDPKNGFSVPVTQFGTTFGFDLNYTDPPGPDPSDFTLVLQKAGLPDFSLFAIRFDPNGTATLMSSASGVGITPQGSTPNLSPAPAVPEASTTVSLGLLLALGMGGVLAAKKRKMA